MDYKKLKNDVNEIKLKGVDKRMMVEKCLDNSNKEEKVVSIESYKNGKMKVLAAVASLALVVACGAAVGTLYKGVNSNDAKGGNNNANIEAQIAQKDGGQGSPAATIENGQESRRSMFVTNISLVIPEDDDTTLDNEDYMCVLVSDDDSRKYTVLFDDLMEQLVLNDESALEVAKEVDQAQKYLIGADISFVCDVEEGEDSLELVNVKDVRINSISSEEKVTLAEYYAKKLDAENKEIVDYDKCEITGVVVESDAAGQFYKTNNVKTNSYTIIDFETKNDGVLGPIRLYLSDEGVLCGTGYRD